MREGGEVEKVRNKAAGEMTTEKSRHELLWKSEGRRHFPIMVWTNMSNVSSATTCM